MKNKKGFISTSIIYSFFLVFILLMIAILMSYANKRFLIEKVGDNFNPPGGEVLGCEEGDSLVECLFKNEYIEHMNATYFNSVGFSVNEIKSAISGRTSPNLSIAADKEEGMYATIDDYGTTYYYRGAEDDNYVSFANNLWSIVRINGDGSIRLIYQGKKNYSKANVKSKGFIDVNYDNSLNIDDARHFNINVTTGTKCDVYATMLEKNQNRKEKFCTNVSSTEIENDYFLIKYCNNKDKNISKYLSSLNDCGVKDDYNGATSVWNIGFMKNGKSTINNGDKMNNNVASNALEYLYSWYIGNIVDTDYANYISYETLFCGNKDFEMSNPNWFGSSSLVNFDMCYCSSSTKFDYFDRQNMRSCSLDFMLIEGMCVEKGYNKNNFQVKYHLGSAKDILESKTNNNLDNKLKCPNNEYSKYSTNSTTSKLTHPVGLITPEEIIYAGGAYYTNNNSYYLASTFSYWTSALAMGNNAQNDWAPLAANYFANVYENGNMHLSMIRDDERENVAYIKPVINLKSSVMYTSGTGTIDDPYIIGG